MGDIDTKWCENKLCSNKDAGRTPPSAALRRSDDIFDLTWNSWKQKFVPRVKTYYLVSFSSSKGSHFTTGGHWKLERAAGEGSHPRRRAGFPCMFTPQVSEGQLTLLHSCCLLWIKFEIPSPDMWHFTLVLFLQRKVLPICFQETWHQNLISLGNFRIGLVIKAH